jgi:hypothetical protein
MKITLPNNGFGLAIMLIAIVLLATVPFVLALWLMLKVSPWWVATPVAITASFFTLLLTVKRRA